MPSYDYKCPEHGVVPVFKPMAEAGRKEACRCGKPMQRIFNPQGFIMRPTGYNLGPQDKGYFTGLWRERELGELRGAPTRTDTTEDTSEWAGLSADEMNRLIPEQAHQDLSEWCQANVPT